MMCLWMLCFKTCLGRQANFCVHHHSRLFFSKRVTDIMHAKLFYHNEASRQVSNCMGSQPIPLGFVQCSSLLRGPWIGILVVNACFVNFASKAKPLSSSKSESVRTEAVIRIRTSHLCLLFLEINLRYSQAYYRVWVHNLQEATMGQFMAFKSTPFIPSVLWSS